MFGCAISSSLFHVNINFTVSLGQLTVFLCPPRSYHELLDYVREHGVTQFLNVWEKVKSRENDELLWGDEIEYHLFSREGNGRLVVSNRAAKILGELVAEDEKMDPKDRKVTWHPEFGAWMIEATPSKPYAGFASDLRQVESNMRYRRFRVQQALNKLSENNGPSFGIVSIVAWPRLGTPEFWEPRVSAEVRAPISQSIFIPDECINPHPRFGTLVGNIRRRRGRKVDIRMPLLKDVNTPDMPTFEVAAPNLVGPPQQVPEIYMDAMGFGMGNCCLQVTFQARDLEESRYLYDQLSILCPIFLALTAGTPVLKGLLADTDVRWNVIAQSVDCRTPTELGAAKEAITLPGGEIPQRDHGRIRKSRYDSIDLFMSNHPSFRDEYNDVNSEIDKPTFDRLVKAGVDERLASHVAHLFIRDPLVIFSERVTVDDATTTEHFENIQSTNWQTMRWKPPPINSPMGWRVEFRPMEVQFSDLENAAFTVVVMLCARVILFFDLSLYIPMSKVDENMQRAHGRDAVLKQKFWFRKNLVPLEAQCPSPGGSTTAAPEAEWEEMSIAEILLGKGENFPGLVPLIWAYLDVIQIDPETRSVVNDYIDIVVKRAKGALMTPAKWIRNFVDKHPAYKKDSVVTDEIERDLIEEIVAISHGEKICHELLGSHRVCRLEESPQVDRLEMKLRQPPGKALRGSSFHNELNPESTSQCAVIRELLQKYRNDGAGQSPVPKRESVLAEGVGFDQARPMFKRAKTE